MKLLGTRLANVMIAAAVISDTLGLVSFAVLLTVTGQESAGWQSMALSLGKAVLFFGVTVLAGLKVFPLVGDLLKKTGVTGRTAK